MQELKKILEEIEKGTHTFELLGRDVDFVAIDWVRDVIRKYMNDDNEIMEQCPYCENEAALHWDVEKDGHQVFCPNCGKPMMLCSMCDARDGAVCDWKEGEGCKHSDERYRDYFRKHMNDGWIPVEKFGLPTSNEHDFRFWITIRYTTGFRHTIKAKWDYFDKCFVHQNGKKILHDVIAYKYYSTPEPYRPERRTKP